MGRPAANRRFLVAPRGVVRMPGCYPVESAQSARPILEVGRLQIRSEKSVWFVRQVRDEIGREPRFKEFASARELGLDELAIRFPHLSSALG
jgi:hypothetical protein